MDRKFELKKPARISSTIEVDTLTGYEVEGITMTGDSRPLLVRVPNTNQEFILTVDYNGDLVLQSIGLPVKIMPENIYQIRLRTLE
jgi:hypothetical protein